MTIPAQRVEDLLTIYTDPKACLADLLCDRHPVEAVAFTVVEPDLSAHDLTFGELRERSRRFAAALVDLGVQPGDRVATLMGKSAELVVALLGIWRRGAVHVPLFTAFAPSAIAMRLTGCDAKVVIVDAAQRAKLLPGEDIPADAPWRTVVAGAPGAGGDLAFDALLEAYQPDDPRVEAALVGGHGEFVRLFTSGTTGTPKGVPIPARAIAAFLTYFEYGLGVEPDDVFWNAADPGWGYGLYYAIIAPLAAGHRSILLHAGFSAELTYRVLSTFGVTNFAAAPTVYRVLRSDPKPIPTDLVLRRCSSAGEPLNPEMVSWSERALGVPVHDTYGLTELGMAVVNGWHPDVAGPVKPGSMGQPMPGWWLEVLHEDRDEIAPTGAMGRVAVDLSRSPLMWFTAYADAPEKTAERFSADGRWYYTGDTGAHDEEGYLFFSSRDDDVIIMAGYRIGPFDVENVLVAHPDVVDAAVIGVPDELRGEVLEAFVVLRPGVAASPELSGELQQLVKHKFAAHAYPRTVHFVAELPKTPSGKIQRYVLRNRRRAELAARPPARTERDHEAARVVRP
jgi:acetyl-CoA synthetase